MKISVLGSGVVGEVLANGLINSGYEVMRGSRDLAKLQDWARGKKVKLGSFEEAARFGDIIILSVKGTAALEALEMCNSANLAGKVIIDTCNPIADRPPTNGVLSFFTGPNESLMERMQSKFSKSYFVKAFSCVGSAFMVNPVFGGQKPTMFICGNDDRAKSQVCEILSRFGWEWEDMGGVEAARAIEPLCMLWCIPGLRGGQWNHAFKLLKG